MRINGGGSPLQPNDVTVAEVLKRAGHATGIFGMWGLGDASTGGVPNEQGFDEYGYLHQVQVPACSLPNQLAVATVAAGRSGRNL